MNPGKHIKTVRNLKAIAWLVLLLLSILVFVFALISGSEEVGLVKNSLNALPWLALLLVIIYTWKKPVFGGLILIVLGLAMVYFFNFRGTNFFLTTFIMTLVIPDLGFVILFCGYYFNNLEDSPNKTQ